MTSYEDRLSRIQELAEFGKNIPAVDRWDRLRDEARQRWKVSRGTAIDYMKIACDIIKEKNGSTGSNGNKGVGEKK